MRAFRLTGDLDGDGSEEAVVLLAEHSGGTGEHIYLALVARRAGALRNVATVRIGDRVQIRAARVDGQEVVMDLVHAGPQDAACCPGELITRRWQLKSDRLHELRSAGRRGRLTLDTIAGGEWVLRAWGFDETAPASPEVTVTFRDGQFTGQAGCNRYVAPAKDGEMPGDVSVAPAGTTRMACPEEQMAVESRFLASLAGVKKFGFMVGQLALSYGRDGVWRTMLFDWREGEVSPTPASR